MAFSLGLPNGIGYNDQEMLILLTCKEPKNTFVDTVSRVKKVLQGGGVTVTLTFQPGDPGH